MLDAALLWKRQALAVLSATVFFLFPGAAQADEILKNNANVTLADADTVAYVSGGDEFGLDYGEGVIKIDTNDAWPNLFKREAYKATTIMAEGDKVWVSGKIDNNWFNAQERRSRELPSRSNEKIST